MHGCGRGRGYDRRSGGTTIAIAGGAGTAELRCLEGLGGGALGGGTIEGGCNMSRRGWRGPVGDRRGGGDEGGGL
jgi:hypothetical protein